MFSKISNFWSEYNFYIIVGLLILVLIIIGIANKTKGKEGTWSEGMFNMV